MAEQDNLIELYDLAFNALPVAENPHMPHDFVGYDHWFCEFSADGFQFDFYLTLGPDYQGKQPSPEFAMERVLEDVATFKNCNGYQDLARIIGLEETDTRVEVAFAELERLDGEIQNLLELDRRQTIGMGS